MKLQACFLVLFLLGVARSSFINSDVLQTINADSHILQIDAVVTLDLPNSISEPYLYLIDPENVDNLSFIEAKVWQFILLIVFSTSG